MAYNIRNIILFACFRLFTNTEIIISSAIGNIKCAWWNVSRSGWCKFKSLPIIIKHHSGTIKIGKNYFFCSAQWANAAGINRRTCLSTSAGAGGYPAKVLKKII